MPLFHRKLNAFRIIQQKCKIYFLFVLEDVEQSIDSTAGTDETRVGRSVIYSLLNSVLRIILVYIRDTLFLQLSKEWQ